MKLTIVTTIALASLFCGAVTAVGQFLSVTPDSLDVALMSNDSTNRQLTVTNTGLSDAVVNLSLRSAGAGAASAVSLANRMRASHDASPNVVRIAPPDQSRLTAQAAAGAATVYAGDHLQFGLTDYGEIMPFQFPVGNEHLQLGSPISGYTVAYRVAGYDQVAFASNQYRSGLVPVSYTEIENSSSAVIVEVVTKTSDDLLILTQRFTFYRDDQYVNVETRIANNSNEAVTDVVFKSYADWDTDQNYYDNWDYDLTRNMVAASRTNYTAIASSRVPELMDIYGWGDYSQRETYVDFPVGPVTDLDGLGILHFNLGDLETGSSITLETVYGAGSTLADLQAAIDRGLRPVKWLSVDAMEATISAGTSHIFNLLFSASGLNGGDYFADLNVSSNDSTQPVVRVPAHLKVTGIPDIFLDSTALTFKSQFIDYPVAETVTVKNTGTDLLVVSSVSSSHSDFVPSSTGFALTPGSRLKLVVTFTPSAAGVRSGTLTLTSNDPDRPVVTVPLTGTGLIPPVVAVSPDSLDSHLLSGESETQTLTISNSGGSDLVWTLSIVPVDAIATASYSLSLPLTQPTPNEINHGSDTHTTPGGMWRTTPLQTTLHDLTGVTILFDGYHSSGGGYYDWSTLVSNLQSRGATVSVNSLPFTAATLADIDIVWVTDFYSSWSSSELSALQTWLFHGGSLLVEGDESVSGYNTILSTLGAGITYVAEGGSYGVTTDIVPHETTAGVDSLYLDNPLALLSPVVAPAMVLVRDRAGHVNVACSQVQRGRIVAMANENFTNYTIGVVDNQVFANQVFDWLANVADFISADIQSGTVTAGELTNLTLTFDATGLNGGDYLADLNINSNDPGQPVVRVPAHLKVTGIPDVSVEPGLLDFGSIFVAHSAVETLTVKNVGTAVLTVSGVSSDNTDFVPGASAFTLAPGNQRKFPIIFTPSNPSLRTGLLTLASDDPDTPEASVALRGQGLVPPVIAVAPDSLDSDLLTGATEIQTLTISNSGGSDLFWRLEVGRADALATTSVTLPVPSAPANFSTVSQGSDRFIASSMPARTTSVQANLQDLTGVRIMRDDSHSGYYSLSSWSDIVNDLRSRGATVWDNLASITPALLDTVDIVWIVDHGSSWSAAEESALGTWLASGGGLLIEGDEELTDYNGILASAGAGIVYTGQSPASGITTNIEPHLTTEGIDSIYNNYPLARLSTVEAPAGILIRDIAGGVNVAYSQVQRGRIVAMADENFGDYAIGVVDNQLFANQVFDWLANVANFISIDSVAGTIAAGGHIDIPVTFDATGLNGGDYFADLNVSSNDSTQPLVRVPAHLHVTGAPDIAVDSVALAFGSRFIGYATVETLTVINNGTDLLTVSSVSCSLADFVAGTSGFTLTPDARLKVPVTFTPSAAGVRSGTLTLTSNDPDRPVVTVPLSGTGLIPPVVAVSPDSLDSHLLTNEISTRHLTITNSGGSDLTWSLDAEVRHEALQPLASAQKSPGKLRLETSAVLATSPAPGSPKESSNRLTDAPPAGAVAIAPSSGDSSILVIQDWSAWSLDMHSFIWTNFGLNATVINSSQIGSTDLSPFDIIVTVGDQGYPYENNLSVNIAKFQGYVAAGGIMQYQLATPGDNVTIVNGAQVLYGNIEDDNRVVMPDHPIVAGLPTLLSDATNLCYLSGLPSNAQVITVTNVGGKPTTAEYTYGKGRVIVTGIAVEYLSYYGYYYGYVAAPLLYNMTAYSLSLTQVSWLSLNPTSGIVPAGSSADVTVTIDATGLGGGDYFADLTLSSNDPGRPEVKIPTHLHVTGVPDITVQPDSVNFGTVYVGASSRRNILVKNRGTDLLAVTGISSGNATFSVSPNSFTLAPRESTFVEVAFAPSTDAFVSTVLVLTSNDPDHPAFNVPLNGRGLFPPAVHVSPDSLLANLSLTVNPRQVDLVSIHNLGASDLTWTAEVRALHYRDSGLFMLNPPSATQSQPPSGESEPSPNSRPALRTYPLEATLLDLTGVNVLFDASHNNYNGIDLWSAMVNNLHNRNATVTANYSAPITHEVLANVDVLWLTDHDTYWGGAEIDALRDWLLNGGALLIEGDASLDQYNSILSALEAGITYTSASGVSGVTTTIFPHDMTGGIEALYNSGAYAQLIVEAPAGELVRDASGGTNIAYSKVGAGRVVAMADENFGDYAIGVVDNQIFANQVFDWLTSGVDWVTVSPINGIVPPGLMDVVDATIDASDLRAGTYTAVIDVKSNDPLTPSLGVPVTLHLKAYICGDVDVNGLVNSADVDYLVRHYFRYGPAPVPLQSGDVNCDGSVNIADICLIARFVSGLSALNCCP